MTLYLPCSALSADHQRLVHGLHLALYVSVGLLSHYEDVGFGLLDRQRKHLLETVVRIHEL